MTSHKPYEIKVSRDSYYTRYESSNLSVSVNKGEGKALLSIRITPFNWSAHFIERNEAARLILAMRKA